MAKFCKRFKKGAKRIDKKIINNKKGLKLAQTFDITTSFYGKKKVKKPYVTFTAHGDYRISVIKLTLLLLLGISLFTTVVLCLHALVERCRAKKRRGKEEYASFYESGDEMPLEEDEIPF